MKQILMGWTIFVLFAFGVSLGKEPAYPQPASSQRPPFDREAGKAAYEENCARCHGLTGQGDGPDAKRMFPKPRSLADGIFKFRTTASGSPPTDEDLFATLSMGLPGSRMPDFQRLPEETRWHLVAYIKSLSTVFEESQPERVELGTDPGPKNADLKRGKELYAQLGCASCHGNLGRADGPSAPTLIDNWGMPTKAADLTLGFSYRRGSSPREIVARVLTGIDGTPMPSYLDAVSKEDAWHLAYYVHSLQVAPRWGRRIEAMKAEGPLPLDLNDPIWQKAPQTDLRLSSLYYQQGEIQPTTVTFLSVQAIHNKEEIAFRLVWNDPTQSRDTPLDAFAIVSAPDRKEKFKLGSLRSWPASQDAPVLDQIAWNAQQEESASYSQGQWTVLVKSAFPAQPSPALIGFMVWDGGNQEEGRRRANSNWVDLVWRER